MELLGKGLKAGEKASRECPKCHGKKIVKAGTRETICGQIQRFLCKSCSYRFSESAVLCLVRDNRLKRQLSAILKEAKKLDSATETKIVAVERNKIEQETTGKILEYLWYLHKEGRKPVTILSRRKDLIRLQKHGANLLNPESVKEIIANEKVSQNTKNHYVTSYDGFAKWFGINWKASKYKFERKIPWLPTETQLDQLIAGCKPRLAAFLQILKETMARAGEAWALKWTDIRQHIKHKCTRKRQQTTAIQNI
jgi:integrase